MADRFDVAVIGGGMVGSAIAVGCARLGARTVLVDEGDVALRAARGNFGLIWSQGKGDGMPAYAAWTRESLRHWDAFADAMSRAAGTEIGYRRSGGLIFAVGEQEWAQRREDVRRLHNQAGGPSTPVRLLDRHELEELLPSTPLGSSVVGASFAPEDGHVNPLLLLRGMHAGLRAAGGEHRPGAPVESVRPGFTIHRGNETIASDRVVIAAGLGTPRLAAMLGMRIAVHPVRGQNMVTERLPPLLPLPASAIRQTAEGVVQIGVSYEENHWETATTVTELARMAARAVAVLPPLAHARMVRAWGALRPMTPDRYPIYAQSRLYPGAYVAVCHSGVTLAAAHAGPLAAGILAGRLPDLVAELGPDRFHADAA
ncbi:FAD-binding oxidoreductase [Elioraea tepida]|jgi:glycine/D-amino acid oxidase-like deaminating enzyme|uniref:FAD-binding oxidoreductase n=1 Tax=Elioraea tepida TaxID=2843330 RepID=A0A975U0D7_9PROT|nr:FAD-dependent oxidoreductase [Elioraea tepida]QXM23939.1 FAD-binding oxidoreductase [Elioraea tepida]